MAKKQDDGSYIIVPLTPEEEAELAQHKKDVEALLANDYREKRHAAYTLESDPLNFKWQETQDEADYTAWLAKKAEIQARYPEPEALASK